jgi:hypothetical protein
MLTSNYSDNSFMGLLTFSERTFGATTVEI